MIEHVRKSPFSRPRVALLFLVISASSYTLASAAMSSGFRKAARSDRPDATIPNPYESSHGTHLVAYVVAASDCGWSRQPETLSAIRSLPATLRRTHGNRYKSIGVVATILDRDVSDGIAFVKTIAGEEKLFDQVSLGGGWLNEHLLRRVWGDSLVPAASPQIILVTRSVDTSDYLSRSRIQVGDDSLLVVVSGSSRISSWIRNGATLDATEGVARGSRTPSNLNQGDVR
jgi:hypothetical protein